MSQKWSEEQEQENKAVKYCWKGLLLMEFIMRGLSKHSGSKLPSNLQAPCSHKMLWPDEWQPLESW